jgi:hypothetical protein
MTERRKQFGRSWVIGGIALVLALVLGANAHLIYVAFSSQPGCAEATVKAGAGGDLQVLRPAKGGC